MVGRASATGVCEVRERRCGRTVDDVHDAGGGRQCLCGSQVRALDGKTLAQCVATSSSIAELHHVSSPATRQSGGRTECGVGTC